MMKLLKCWAILVLLGLGSLDAVADPVRVLIKTDQGNITLELFSDKAPANVENFLAYVKRAYYDGLIFHRVVRDFVIQSGGYTIDLAEKETAEPVVNESGNGLSNLRGTVAMARTSDPDSATSQFFINLNDNTNLDQRAGRVGYTVFGKVIEGMDVVDKIGAVPVKDKGNFQNIPRQPIRILSARELTPP